VIGSVLSGAKILRQQADQGYQGRNLKKPPRKK